MKYLIYSRLETDYNYGEPMFWHDDVPSSDDFIGWGSIHNATRYDLSRIHMVEPLGAGTMWMTEEVAKKFVINYYEYQKG